MSESELLSGVLELLQYLQNQGKLVHMRLNSGSVIVPGKNKNYRIKLAPEGTADVLVIRKRDKRVSLMPKSDLLVSMPTTEETQIYFIETKAPDGGKQSDAQIKFQKQVEAQGAIYMLVKNLDTVIDEFTE